MHAQECNWAMNLIAPANLSLPRVGCAYNAQYPVLWSKGGIETHRIVVKLTLLLQISILFQMTLQPHAACRTPALACWCADATRRNSSNGLVYTRTLVEKYR